MSDSFIFEKFSDSCVNTTYTERDVEKQQKERGREGEREGGREITREREGDKKGEKEGERGTLGGSVQKRDGSEKERGREREREFSCRSVTQSSNFYHFK